MIIYKVTNKIDGKCYIGQTIGALEKRKRGHKTRYRNKQNIYFYNALNKHGWDNFEWEVIEECSSKEEMNEMEFHYIKQYDSFGNGGYNLSWGGEGKFGYECSDETKKKMSKGQSKRYEKQEEREKVGLKQKKVWENSEYRENQVKKIRKACGTAKNKENTRIRQRKNWENPEYRKKQMEFRSDEIYRKKLSESIKKSWNDNVTLKKEMGKRVKEMRKDRKEEFRSFNMKKWLINGEEIDDLKTWCKRRNINYSTFYGYKNKNKLYKGKYSLKGVI
jgi:group I intron endonuclease